MPDSALVVFTSLPNPVQAKKLSRQILRRKYAACINLIKEVESFFWWKGKIERANECLLLIKTRRSRFEHLRTFIEKNHPYSVPEIIALPIQKGNRAYLKWLAFSVRSRRVPG